MSKKKKIISITTLIIGLAMLATGLTFLIIKLVGKPPVQDGEYLISAENWTLDEGKNCDGETNCEPSVIWKFTEIGKGTLTTNNHINDYDFIWTLDNGKLKIETKWLYDLGDEYEYKLDQNNGILTLNDGENEYKFIANF